MTEKEIRNRQKAYFENLRFRKTFSTGKYMK